jgi:transposase-like protein
MLGEHRADYGSEWEAIRSIAGKIGCSPETLRAWVRKVQVDTGSRAGVTSDEKARMKDLEKENRELRRANEILRKASAYFAQAELDRRPR